MEIFNGNTLLGTTLVGIDGAWRFTLTADLGANNTLSAKQTDAAGNASASSAVLNVAYNASATLPVIALKSSSDTGVVGDGITANSTPTLEGLGAASGDTITLYNGSTQLGSAVADGTGKWAVSPSASLVDGAYTLTVKNTTTAATVGSLKVLIDTTQDAAPAGLKLALDSDTGSLNDGMARFANPVLEGTGATAGATVRILEGTALVGQAQADGAGNWRVQTVALSDGTHSLKAVQVDAAGNVSAASSPLAVQVDSVAAALSAPVLTLADDSGLAGDGVTNKSTFTVNGQGAEANAWVTVNNASVQLARVQAAADGSWSAVLSAQAAGAYNLTAQQTDAAGNVSATGAALALTVDVASAAPTLALNIASESSNSKVGYTMQTQPTFSGTAEAGAAVSVYDGSILLGSTIADAAGAWSLTSTVTMSLGTHGNVFAKQTDVAGNQSPATASLAVTVLPNVSTPVTYALPAAWNWSVSSGDINGDGAVDLYKAVQGTPDHQLMLGSGTGVFTDAVDNILKPMNSLAGAMATAMVDFNGDGRSDVLSLPAINGGGNLALAYWANRGGATSMANVATAANGYVNSVFYSATVWDGATNLGALGDVNGDGYLDFTMSYVDKSLGNIAQTTLMESTGAGTWRAVRSTESGPLASSSAAWRVQWADVNQDGRQDMVVATGSTANVWLASGQGAYTLASSLVYAAAGTFAMPGLFDLNGDGYLDLFGTGNTIAWGRGDGSFSQVKLNVSDASDLTALNRLIAADINADGLLDLLYLGGSRYVVAQNNGDGTYTNVAASMGWDAGGNKTTLSGRLNSGSTDTQLVDINADRSLDLIVFTSAGGAITLNSNGVAENTFLRVMVANDHGGLDAYGAVVRLYDHDTGALVAVRQASTTSIGNTANAGSYGADFFGLNPTKTYDIAVVYPGSDASVTVVTGKAGLGLGNIAPGSLNQIVDSSLTAVAPGGKDVVWVAKENRSTSATGGYWVGTNLADQMVGDSGADVFMPNGARIGEVGDTLTGGGGRDTYVFNQAANLNTAATITDFTATAGSNADTIDLGALLTKLGYSSSASRDATTAANWVKVTDDGANTTVQIDAHAGAAGAASGFVDVVKLNGVTGKSLATLVSGGFVHLGGVNVSGIAADQTVTEAQARSGVQLAAAAVLTAEGAQWAAGFTGGALTVKLDNATANDTLGFSSQGGVSYNGSTLALSIGGTQVAMVDSTHDGVGAVGQLDIHFDFSAAGASYASNAQQAAAVQTVMQSLKLTDNTYAPLALDRGVSFALTDALGEHAEVLSGVRITPVADTGTLSGVNYVTGTESVETLTGTAAAETLVGYNGVPTLANTANLGTALTFGDTLTGGGGTDTFQWLSKQVMNSDASDKITDFGFKVGTGTGQGAAEADTLDLSQLLEGYTVGSTLSDYVRAVNVSGKLQVQVDYNGKANGAGFEKTWFMVLDNVSMDTSNNVVVNSATMGATAAGLSGNVMLDNMLQQMVADSQFKLL